MICCLFSNVKLMYSTHTHTHLVVFFFCLFVFFHLFTSKDKRTQSDPEKEATLGVCVFALLWTSGCVILIPSFWVPSFCYSHVSISGLFFLFFLFFSFFCSQRKVIPWRTSRWLHTHTQTHTHGVFPFSFEQVRLRLIVPTVLASCFEKYDGFLLKTPK